MNHFINLTNLELKVFTEQNASDYCQINNINQSHIFRLDLGYNRLTDISGIKLFKNLQILSLEKNSLTDISILKDLNNIKILYLGDNKIKDISVIQYLNEIKILFLSDNEIKDISVLKNLNNLEILDLENNEITDISVLKYLNIKKLFITNLKLESDQIKYINSLKNLEKLWCDNGFKNMNIIKQLNKNIEIYDK